MAQVTILDVPVDISGVGTLTLPVTSDGANRKRLVYICAGLTGGTVAVPSAVSCDGFNAVYEAGATVTGQRTAITVFSFTDAQIAQFTTRALTITGGNTQRRVVFSFSIQNTDQSVTNTNGLFDSGTSGSPGSPVSCVRSANSFTFAAVKIMLLSNSTMSNPTRAGTFDTASSRVSFGYQNDTANTSNTTFAHSSALTSELVVNYKEVGETVDSINGDSSNPDIIAGESNTVATTGLGAITSCVISTTGKGSVTATGSMPSGDGSFIPPFPPANATLYPYFGAVRATFGDGAKSAYIDGTLVIKTGFASTLIADAVDNNSAYLGSVITLPDDAYVYVETGDAVSGTILIGTDGHITVSKALTRNVYVHLPRDYKVYTYEIVVNGGGSVISVVSKQMPSLAIGYGIGI